MMSIPACWLLIALSTVGQDSAAEPEEWKRYTDAATAAVEAGDFAKAEALFVQVVHEAQKLEPNDLRQAPPLERLARFYASKVQKRYADAEPLLRQALAIRERLQGTEDPALVETLLALGFCTAKSKEKPAGSADALFQRALAIVEKAHGRDNPEVAHVLHGMAFNQIAQHDFSAAENSLTRAIAICTKSLGPENATLAKLLDDQGDLHLAQFQFFDKERMRARMENKDVNETASERHGRLAQESYTHAFEIRERTLKPTDPAIAESLFNLAQLAMIRQTPVEGDAYMERWFAFQKRVGAPASKKQINSLQMWTHFAMARKDWAETQRRLEKAQPVVEQVEGIESDALCEFLTTRADVAVRAKQFDDAERYLKRGLEIQASLCEPNDPNIKLAQRLMAGHYQDYANDPRGFLLWNDLAAFSEDVFDQKPANRVLGVLLDGYVDLLHHTNKAVPRPSAADIAFLGGELIPADVDMETRIRMISHPLDSSKFNDATLVHVTRFYNATDLILNDRSVTDDGLVHLKNLTGLRHVELDRTQISDAGLAHLAGHLHLKELHLNDTRVGDAGLQHLARLTSLRELQLDGTNVTDAGLERIAQLPSLRTVSVKGTRVTHAVIERLRRARPELRVEYKTLNLPPAEAVPSAAAVPSATVPSAVEAVPSAVEAVPSSVKARP